MDWVSVHMGSGGQILLSLTLQAAPASTPSAADRASFTDAEVAGPVEEQKKKEARRCLYHVNSNAGRQTSVITR